MNNVIIVAGGKGQRMESELPKQFICIDGIPILMRTMRAFYDFDNSINIVLVLTASYQEYWLNLCKQYQFDVPHVTTQGGKTRFHSVKNGLALISKGIVAIHDAARPFVSKNLIADAFDATKKYGAVIPVTDVTDSLRVVSADSSSKIVDRSHYRLVQTPQVFKVDLLQKAYQVEYNSLFTDDASVVEHNGVEIHMIIGERTNIKITTPFDLKLANVIAKS